MNYVKISLNKELPRETPLAQVVWTCILLNGISSLTEQIFDGIYGFHSFTSHTYIDCLYISSFQHFI